MTVIKKTKVHFRSIFYSQLTKKFKNDTITCKMRSKINEKTEINP